MILPSSLHRPARAAGRPLAAVALASLTAATIASCGGGAGTGLIPASDAVALKGDLQEVARVVKTADGNCSATTAAIERTERDFETLPSSVDSALREKLDEGISNLRANAIASCESEQETSTKSKTTEEPSATTTTTPTTTSSTTATTSTTTSSTTATTSTTTIPEETTTEATTTEEITPEETTTSAPGGGTAAPTTPATGGGTASGLEVRQAHGVSRWEAAEAPGR